jgi:hypothetical protein
MNQGGFMGLIFFAVSDGREFIEAQSVRFEVAHFDRICPEGAKQNSPGQSEVALRHERRPGKQKTTT